MNHTPDPNEPTRRQCADAERVQAQMLHEANLLASEGVGPHEIVAGMGSALADVIATSWGQAAVAQWFASQASLIQQLQRPAH
jgi:hypothetical protein